MSNEELDSQLSAMFDDELPAPECELLARRLARDEQLRARWGHYAAIGACIRGEPGVRLETTLASKVSAAIKQETSPGETPATGGRKQGWLNPWLTSLGGLASAAAVAAVAILWMRSEAPRSLPRSHQPVPRSAPSWRWLPSPHPRRPRRSRSWCKPRRTCAGRTSRTAT